MPESNFEFLLERMFAEAPRAPDADLFAALVMGRLDRGWTARRFIIGGMGLVGGLIGAGQLVGANGFGRAVNLVTEANALLTRALASAMPPDLPAGDVGFGAEVIWITGALLVVGAGLGLARLFREI